MSDEDGVLSPEEIRAINAANLKEAWRKRHTRTSGEKTAPPKVDDHIVLVPPAEEMTIAEAVKETGLSSFFFSKKNMGDRLTRRKEGSKVYLRRDEVRRAADAARPRQKMTRKQRLARDLERLRPKRLDPKTGRRLRDDEPDPA